MALTRQEAELVNETIPALRQHGEHISTVFYKTMLRDHPELNDYFNSVNMHTGKQPRALTALILAFASNIVNISELTPKLERVAQKHASLHICQEHYEIVAKYLIRAFSAVLGPAMTPEVNAAWTKAYWLMAKMLTGREAIIYKSFSKWDGWRKFTISEKTPETTDGDIVSFTFRPADGKPLPSFKPGQYVTVRLKIKGLKYYQLRQYSFSDAPHPDFYRVTVKRDVGAGTEQTLEHQFGLNDDPPMSSAASSASDSSIGSVRPRRPGLVSNALIDEFKVGDSVELTHPAGEFFLDINDANNSPVVLISGGAGAGPLFSMLKTVTEQNNKNSRPISWIHASRHEALFREKVESIVKTNPSVKARFFRSRLADGDVISLATRFHEDFSAMSWEDLWLHKPLTQYFICGPERFMTEVGNHLLKNGVQADRVKFELYSVGSFELKTTR